jgi:uncharacterized protein YbbK (DUF523 family)
MSRFPTPIIVVSRCLGFDACRYDGEIVDDQFVARLAPYAELVAVCPEIEIGLGVPREKIRLVGTGPAGRLVQPATGRDLTETMREFADDYLARLRPDGVDGFILKSRSPSCGLTDTKIFKDSHTEEVAALGPGVLALAATDMFPDLAVADEVGLADPEARRAFLARVFGRAWIRQRSGETPPEPPYPTGLL